MYKLIYLNDLFKLLMASLIALFLKVFKKNKDVWIIGERKDEAKDNGYHLFKYIREKYPEIEIYYVIEKNSSDFNKIIKLGNVIIHDSFQHYIKYILASKLICAHLGSGVPDSPICWKAENLKIIKKTKIFIQHGVTMGKIKSLMYDNTKVKMFVCGAEPEYNFVKSEFSYPEDTVKYLGFCRFDNLHDYKTKKQILIMPTWRQWFGMSATHNISEVLDVFLESEYYCVYQSLLNNNKLHDLLKDNNYELIFYPHYEMQRFIQYFNVNNERIKIANKNNYNVQQLLKESAILVTDFSSVALDFGYMRKPVIYYQFDSGKYYESHYAKGYYDYEKHGFGPVVKKENDLLVMLEEIVKGRFLNLYLDRCMKFFPLHDKENCKRHYEEIKNIK